MLESQLPFVLLVSKSWSDVDEAILEEVGVSPASADGMSSPSWLNTLERIDPTAAPSG